MAQLTEDQEEREMRILHYWHIERFHELGFPHHQAEILALSQVDWHEADLLLKRQCSHELVIEILA